MNNLTDKVYWENLEIKPLKKIRNIEFSSLFFRYLNINNKNSRKTMLEIGCLPARYLAFLSKMFHYFPEGIDFVKGSRNICRQTLINMGIKKFKLYEEDFLGWKANKKYDLVCSFGFIEHFINPEPVIIKHISLTKKNGVIIIEIPNFGGWQKILHQKLDYADFMRHNLSMMNLMFFIDMLRKHNLKKIYAGYYGGLFNFWWNNKRPSSLQKLSYSLLRIVSKITWRINLNNKLLSPYIVLIAEKINS